MYISKSRLLKFDDDVERIEVGKLKSKNASDKKFYTREFISFFIEHGHSHRKCRFEFTIMLSISTPGEVNRIPSMFNIQIWNRDPLHSPYCFTANDSFNR